MFPVLWSAVADAGHPAEVDVSVKNRGVIDKCSTPVDFAKVRAIMAKHGLGKGRVMQGGKVVKATTLDPYKAFTILPEDVGA